MDRTIDNFAMDENANFNFEKQMRPGRKYQTTVTTSTNTQVTYGVLKLAGSFSFNL
jgi:hypothetical protein